MTKDETSGTTMEVGESQLMMGVLDCCWDKEEDVDERGFESGGKGGSDLDRESRIG